MDTSIFNSCFRPVQKELFNIHLCADLPLRNCPHVVFTQTECSMSVISYLQ